METKWQETKHGGLRRTSHTRVAQNRRALLEAEENTSAEQGRGRRIVTLPRVQIKFAEKLGLESCPYLIRWRLETPWFSVRLHHWLAPDDERFFHDHPWDFLTFVLRGAYTDAGPTGLQYLKAPVVQYRAAEHRHTVYPDKGGAWTLVFTGPKIRQWGFWVGDKFRKANKYFLIYGHHPCN